MPKYTKNTIRGEGESKRKNNSLFDGSVAPQATDIGRRSSGRFDRTHREPEISTEPIAREQQTGRFQVDPFDITPGYEGAPPAGDATRFDVEDPDTLADVYETGWDETTPDDDRGVLDEPGVDFETFGREVEAREQRFAGALDTTGATMQVIEDARRGGTDTAFGGSNHRSGSSHHEEESNHGRY